MTAKTNFIKTSTAALLGGALVLSFSPAALAPTAFAASEAEVNAVKAAIDVYRTDGDASAVTEKAAQDVADALTTYNVQVSDLPVDYQNYVLRCQLYNAQNDLDEANQELKTAQSENTKLQKQVQNLQNRLSRIQNQVSSNEATTLKSKTKITKLTVTSPGMGKLVASWKVSNPIDGLRYQVQYRAGSSGKWTSVKTKKLTKTFKNLAGNATYTCKVRAYKKLSGKFVYSSWSKKASAKVIASYSAGTYKVTGDYLNVRKTAGSTSQADVLVSVPNGTKVKVQSVKVVKGSAWGKITYNGQTGWVQMQYLKKA